MNYSTPSSISSIFSSLSNPAPCGILPINARRLRRNMRHYLTSTPPSTPGSDASSITSSSSSSRGPTYTPPPYSNWVFVTSAEVLARAAEGEEDGEEGEQAGEGEHGAQGGQSAAGGTIVKSGWTKRQYREESDKLRGKEWVFQ